MPRARWGLTLVVKPNNMLGTTIIAFQSKIYVVGFFYSLNSRTILSKVENITMDTSAVRSPLSLFLHSVDQ